jgi:hypothetical protein
MIAGSANLSSSNNVEQFQIIHDKRVISFVRKILNGVISKHTILKGKTGKTIFENNKGNTGKDAYNTIKESASDG